LDLDYKKTVENYIGNLQTVISFLRNKKSGTLLKKIFPLLGTTATCTLFTFLSPGLLESFICITVRECLVFIVI